MPADVRDPLLKICLWASAACALILVFGTASRPQAVEWSHPLLWVLFSLVILMFHAASWQKAPENYRVALLGGFFHFVALLILSYRGFTPLVALFLTFGVLLSGMLLGLRMLVISFALSCGWIALAGAGWIYGVLPPQPGRGFASPRSVEHWIANLTGFATGCGLIVLMVYYLVGRLQAHVQRERETAAQLARERERHDAAELARLRVELEAQTALRQSAAEMSGILAAAPSGIAMLRQRVFQRVNQRFADIFGSQAEELIGQTARQLYFDNESYERVGRELYRRAPTDAAS